MDYNVEGAQAHINEMDRRTYEYEHECVCCLDNERSPGFDKGIVRDEFKVCLSCVKNHVDFIVNLTGLTEEEVLSKPITML